MVKKNLEIGQKLYRIVPPSLHVFTVTGIRKYQDSEQYEVECEGCKHGWKCRCLVAWNDYGQMAHVQMLNEEEDWEQHRCWHTDESFYYVTEKEARIARLKNVIADQKKLIEDREAALNGSRKNLLEYENALAALGKAA